MYNDISLPQVLLLGDSSVKGVKLPGCITYCLSNGRIGDFIKLLPKLLHSHTSVKIVIVHTGTNEIMDRQSARLHLELEELSFQIESLGKRCILSGPLPSPSMGSEYFSRLYGLHQWLCHFCVAAGFNFIPNFDSFWTRHDLFNADRFHLNRRGTKLLTSNLVNYIAFGMD